MSLVGNAFLLVALVVFSTLLLPISFSTEHYRYDDYVRALNIIDFGNAEILLLCLCICRFTCLTISVCFL